MNAKRIVVSGYATLDYVVQLFDGFDGTGTAMGELGLSDGWPRAGGAALYASRRLAAAGHSALPLTWIGEDNDAELYLRACQEARLCGDAIDQRAEARTARCILLYHPDGSYGCVLDSGSGARQTLSLAQADAARASDHVCISAGPPMATAELLDACPSSIGFSWIAKHDVLCFPIDLAARLAGRAGLIFCNAGERAFVEAARAGGHRADQIIVETRGGAGVLIECGQGKRMIPSDAIPTHDTTGAGDTLAGEVVARYLKGGVTIDAAVGYGMAAARNLLSSRIPDEGRSI